MFHLSDISNKATYFLVQAKHAKNQGYNGRVKLQTLCWQRQIATTPWWKQHFPQANLVKTRCKKFSWHPFRPISLSLASPTKAQVNVAGWTAETHYWWHSAFSNCPKKFIMSEAFSKAKICKEAMTSLTGALHPLLTLINLNVMIFSYKKITLNSMLLRNKTHLKSCGIQCSPSN